MAATTQRAGSSPTAQILPAHVVGGAFAQQYYLILRTSPDTAYKFYHGDSRVFRPSTAAAGGGSGMDCVTTLKGIKKKIQAMGKATVDVERVESKASESHAGGVAVVVTGRVSRFPRGQPRAFSQSFLLAPQDGGGYFVLEDTLTYAENDAPAPAA